MASRKQQQKKAWLLSYTAELKPINGSDDQCHRSIRIELPGESNLQGIAFV